MENGRKILYDHYGGDQSANYIDYYLRKVEIYVNLILDHNKSAKTSSETPIIDIDEIKNELAQANESFINLSKKVNRDPTRSEQ